MSPRMGYCTNCGARCMAVEGAAGNGSKSRATKVAAASLTDRRLGYVIESKDPVGGDLSRLVCRECVHAVTESMRP